jgi:hypothetical protein
MDGERPPCKQNIFQEFSDRDAARCFPGWETYLVIDEGSKGKEVKQIGEEAPHVGVSIFSQAFIVESVHLRDLS